jgi:hypothetical protein
VWLGRTVRDVPAADGTVGNRGRPGGQSNGHVRPAAQVVVQPKNDREANLVVVFVHVKVMKAVHDTVDELDPQRLIVRPDVYPVPRNGPRTSPGCIGTRRLTARHALQQVFGRNLSNSSHTVIIAVSIGVVGPARSAERHLFVDPQREDGVQPGVSPLDSEGVALCRDGGRLPLGEG